MAAVPAYILGVERLEPLYVVLDSGRACLFGKRGKDVRGFGIFSRITPARPKSGAFVSETIALGGLALF